MRLKTDFIPGVQLSLQSIQVGLQLRVVLLDLTSQPPFATGTTTSPPHLPRKIHRITSYCERATFQHISITIVSIGYIYVEWRVDHHVMIAVKWSGISCQNCCIHQYLRLSRKSFCVLVSQIIWNKAPYMSVPANLGCRRAGICSHFMGTEQWK